MTNTEKKISGNVVAGVDVGSLAAKSVIIADGEIVGHGLIPSGFNSEETGKSVLQHALNSAGVPREALKYIVATGYGRISADYASKTVTEISCHARGANFLYPSVRTIIDIGGQD
ncbi:(R)-2-hydroxyglutaryl-CoA dehydratase activator, partial [Candidatus Termititenax persephonae]